MGSVGIGGISGAARDALHPPTTSNQILLDLLEDILDIINMSPSQHPVFTCKVRPEAVVVVLQEAVQQLGHVVRGLGGGNNSVSR